MTCGRTYACCNHKGSRGKQLKEVFSVLEYGLAKLVELCLLRMVCLYWQKNVYNSIGRLLENIFCGLGSDPSYF
jgi:hypothetical protein